MTDDGRFLSRRERRAQEDREATNVPADTDALALGPISESIPTHAPDGRMLSRRERRRLERARQPMETWTAEEEMIATGQIPAMTPERIAEQEKLARERAAEAQREAEQASAELQDIVGHPAVSPAEPIADPPAQPMWAPVTQASEPAPSEPESHQPSVADAEHPPSVPGEPPDEPAVPEQPPADEEAGPHEQPSAGDTSPPARSSLIAAVAADVNPVEPEVVDAPTGGDVPSAPSAFESAVFESVEQTDQHLDEPADVPSAPAVFESAAFESAEQTDQHLDEPADVPSAPSAPQPDVEADPPAVASAPAAPAATIPGMPPGMSPEMFASLFPPGSLQRRLMEDQAAAQAASEPEPEPEPEDPAAEIRRLAEEAVAGIDAAGEAPSVQSAQHEEASSAASSAQEEPGSTSSLEPGAPAPWEPASGHGFDPTPQPQPRASSPWDAPAPASESAPEHYSHQSAPSAPLAGAPDSAPPTFNIPAFDTAAPQEPTPPGTTDQLTPPAESSAPPALAPLEDAPFEAILGDHPDAAALDQAANAQNHVGAYSFDSVSTDPAPQAEQPPQEVHGFAPAPGASTPWGEHPLAQVDREAPELPEMPPAQSVPQPDLSSVGFRPQFGQTGQVPIVEPVPTGQIEVPQRARPELTGADVPRSFKWAHLAVFGAVGLLLGVVVWQVLQ